MTRASVCDFGVRLSRARDDMRAAGVEALVVTHLPNVRYLTGFSGTAGAAILDAGRCVLIVDSRYATAARELLASRSADGIVLEIVERGYDEAIVEVLQRTRASRIGIEAASMSVSRFNGLSTALAAGTGMPTPAARAERLRPARGERVFERRSASERGCPPPLVVETAGGQLRRGLAVARVEHQRAEAEGPASSQELVPTTRVIEARRAVKDAYEIATLREAARRLSGVARDARAFVREGRTEQAVAGDIDAAIRSAGFERPAFETIVASGPNSARPHARPGVRTLETGDGVVLDFGGVYDGYCVDLTRTVHLGVPAPALRQIAAAVREAHSAALAAVRPGVRPSQIDAAARQVLVRHGLGDAFGHGTGHGLGLEVHEEPRIGKLPGAHPDTPVEPGMVFTIEPGAYVEGLGGVRIEDDVLVVDGGCEILTDVPIEI